MSITFSPECGSDLEPEPEDLERKKDQVRSPRRVGRPRKAGSVQVGYSIRARIPKFEDFDKD